MGGKVPEGTLSGCHWKRRFSDNISVFSALEVFYDNALYKSTFYFTLLYASEWRSYLIIDVTNKHVVSQRPVSFHAGTLRTARASTYCDVITKASHARRHGDTQLRVASVERREAA